MSVAPLMINKKSTSTVYWTWWCLESTHSFLQHVCAMMVGGRQWVDVRGCVRHQACAHTRKDRAQANELAVCQGAPTTSSLQLQWHPARVLPHQKPLRWWTQSDNNHRIESWQQMTGLTPSSDTTRDQTQPNMSNFRCSQCTGRYQSHTGYGRCQCSTRVVYHRDASLPPTPPPTHSPPT